MPEPFDPSRRGLPPPPGPAPLPYSEEPKTGGGKKTAIVVAAAVLTTAALLVGGILIGKSLGDSPTSPPRPAVAPDDTDPVAQDPFAQCGPAKGLDFTPAARRGNGEPTVNIPTPPGWVSDPAAADAMHPLIRAVLAAPGLTARGATPTAVVTVQEMTGRFQAMSTEELLRGELDGVSSLGRIESKDFGTFCGFPSATVKYTLGQNAAEVIIVVATDPRTSTRWDITCTVQTRDPQNPQYIAARTLILKRLQIGFPPAS